MRVAPDQNTQPVGLILAGGAGTRIGGGKASVALRGDALLHYPLAAMRRVLRDVAVITKAHVELPPVDGAMVWIEPDEPVHPMLGICEALALASGRPVLVCPLDMPFVTAELLARLAGAESDRPVVTAACHGLVRPLLGRYAPSTGPLLAEVAHAGVEPSDAVPRLDAALIEVGDEVELFDVDTPDDLLQAAAMLDLRSPRLSQT